VLLAFVTIALGVFASSPRSALAAADLDHRSLATDPLAASGVRGDLPSASRDSLATDSLAAANARGDSMVAFPSPRVRGWQVGLVRPDRMEHASLSFALTSALIIVTRNRAASAATGLAFGFGKEMWDRRTSEFDPVDLTADAVGVGLATLLVKPHGP
jgi:hypothetical protein